MTEEGIRPLIPSRHYQNSQKCFSVRNDFGESVLSNDLEKVMMFEYMLPYREARFHKRLTLENKEPFSVTEENKGELFQVSASYLEPDINHLTVRSYTEKLPVLEEREAYLTMIFVLNDKVTVNIGNTYKYKEWDEILNDLFYISWKEDSEGKRLPGIWNKRGLRKAFVLLTDMCDVRPIYKIFEETVAGFIVDRDNMDLTVFDPLSAVMIYHELFGLCEQQTTYRYGDDGHSGPDRYYDNSPLEESQNPYVQRYNKLLHIYKEKFKLKDAVDRWCEFVGAVDDGELLE